MHGFIDCERKRSGGLVLGILLVASLAPAQTDRQVDAVLDEEILPPTVAVFQLRQYLLSRVAPLPAVTSAQQWSAESQSLRQHLLKDVVFHGWPEEWVNSPPKFDDLGVIETGEGYRLRKLRYEIVPGFQSVALLYEPASLQGKVPAILNLNGHVGPLGKSVEYKQKRCINFALHGIMALNLEWFASGELAQPENAHWFGAHLDLVGANALGLFYLEMRRGLDYLHQHPNVDCDRLGVTGLSGGGWQTILLSSLDERVKVAVPVAGYAALSTELQARRYGDLGDLEQNGTDLLTGQDYTHLTAMRAPRPTLLVYNAEDDCCYRGPMTKPLVFDAVQPFYKLYGKENLLQYHENREPGTHNYQLDNRLASYRFFSEQFNLPVIESETDVGREIKSYDELVVGLPKNNLTILGLARRLAAAITRPPMPSDLSARASWGAANRQRLTGVVRYKPLSGARVWTVANTKNKGLETKSYLFQMNDGMSATGVWLKSIVAAKNAPVTLVLNDEGKKAAGVQVSDRVNRDEQVLAVDLLFMGDAWHDDELESYASILGAVGDRPLGIEAAQLIEIAHWIRGLAGTTKLRLECKGIRSQVVGLVAAALEPDLFSDLVVHEGVPSLSFLLNTPVPYKGAPELFCLDLYKDFDLDRLAAIAAPTRVNNEKYAGTPEKK